MKAVLVIGTDGLVLDVKIPLTPTLAAWPVRGHTASKSIS